MDIYAIIGQNIRKARKAAGMSQSDLAAQIGLLRTSIVNLEAGRQRTPLHTIVEIAQAMGVAPGLLLPATLWPNTDAARVEAMEQKLADVKVMLQEIIEEL